MFSDTLHSELPFDIQQAISTLTSEKPSSYAAEAFSAFSGTIRNPEIAENFGSPNVQHI